ncbi:MAG TPA: flagellar hook-basal body protein [Candidatus Methylomirabilis sp.]|nr:flagellar hook-basal body protein [Candidatus Methylomirabilis sp.]HSC72080.1 flagellar hook-basal body protein [Candidatus Methylomirabilis sp.]
MISGLYSAASGMAAHQAKLDVLANNLANADTPGFKADLITIDPSVDLANDLSTLPSPTSIVAAGRPGLDLSPGVLRQTGNPLDLAIVGPGLFAVETPLGERYIRAGAFTRDAGGYLTTAEGFRVLGSSGAIRVPDGGMVLDARGRTADGASIRVVTGPGGPGLVKVGANLYAPVDGASLPPDLPDSTVVQGHLETSNVNVVRSMVDMLATMRTYEAHQRMIQAIDQTAGQAANELGRA